MRPLRKALLIVPVFIAAVALIWPTGALAHDHRDVDRYAFTVGFLSEPVVLGQPNGVDLRVVDDGTEKPVEGLEKTLKVEITSGGKSIQLDLTTIFRDPGHYTARFVPTAEGQYVFRFFGAVEGLQVNERFESGPGRFNEPQRLVQFPLDAPDAAALQGRADQANSAAGTARLLAIIGIMVGALGLAAGGGGADAVAQGITFVARKQVCSVRNPGVPLAPHHRRRRWDP